MNAKPLSAYSGRRLVNYETNVRAICPGYDTLHELTGVVLGAFLGDEASILVAGAGLEREIEVLAGQHPGWRFTGFDPSAEMLGEAEIRVSRSGLEDRVTLVEGTVDSVADDLRFDGALSLLVMHFLPDTVDPGGKRDFLEALMTRLKPGAPLAIADILGERGSDDLERIMAAWRRWKLHAGMDPLDEEKGHRAIEHDLPFVTEVRFRELLDITGFEPPYPYYKALAVGAYLTHRR